MLLLVCLKFVGILSFILCFLYFKNRHTRFTDFYLTLNLDFVIMWMWTVNMVAIYYIF